MIDYLITGRNGHGFIALAGWKAEAECKDEDTNLTQLRDALHDGDERFNRPEIEA